MHIGLWHGAESKSVNAGCNRWARRTVSAGLVILALAGAPACAAAKLNTTVQIGHVRVQPTPVTTADETITVRFAVSYRGRNLTAKEQETYGKTLVKIRNVQVSQGGRVLRLKSPPVWDAADLRQEGEWTVSMTVESPWHRLALFGTQSSGLHIQVNLEQVFIPRRLSDSHLTESLPPAGETVMVTVQGEEQDEAPADAVPPGEGVSPPAQPDAAPAPGQAGPSAPGARPAPDTGPTPQGPSGPSDAEGQPAAPAKGEPPFLHLVPKNPMAVVKGPVGPPVATTPAAQTPAAPAETLVDIRVNGPDGALIPGAFVRVEGRPDIFVPTGREKILSLPPGTYTFHGKARGFSEQSATATVPSGTQRPQIVVIALTPEATITVEAYDAGRPNVLIRTEHVTLLKDGKAVEESAYPTPTFAARESGTYTASAFAWGWEQVASGRIAIDSPAPPAAHTLTVKMVRTNLTANVYVHVALPKGVQGVTPVVTLRESARTATDTGVPAVFTEVMPGQVELIVSAPGCKTLRQVRRMEPARPDETVRVDVQLEAAPVAPPEQPPEQPPDQPGVETFGDLWTLEDEAALQAAKDARDREKIVQLLGKRQAARDAAQGAAFTAGEEDETSAVSPAQPVRQREGTQPGEALTPEEGQRRAAAKEQSEAARKRYQNLLQRKGPADPLTQQAYADWMQKHKAAQGR
ncbi:MAG: hypothetical protein JXR37_03225 [Kiritimatiellae bacterium]|nr:hypothetical protein [Kiritimatiellia bacterium]